MKRVGYILGRRVKGDIILDTDPITNAPGRILGPAVRLTNTDQFYDEASVVQNYTLGSRMVVDERSFRYARAGGVLVPDMGVKNASNQYVANRVVTAAAAGVAQIQITCTAADGIAANGTIAANELVGGHIVIFPIGATEAINRRIIANTAISVATTLVMTVTLDRPTPRIIGAGSTGECLHSQYFNVQNDVVNYHSVVGLAMQAAALNDYVWLQTWGPTWMSAQLTVGESLVRVNNRQVVFRADGSLGLAGHTDVAGTFDQTTHYAQHAGYIMASVLGGAQGAPFVYLQIAP